MKKIVLLLSISAFIGLVSCAEKTPKEKAADAIEAVKEEAVDVKDEIEETTEELQDESGEIDIDKLEEMASDANE